MLKLKLFTGLFIIFNINVALSQSVKNTEVKFLIDTAISIMKKNSVNAGKVNWVALKQNAYNQAANFNSPYELGNVMRNLYKSIDDFHGSFFYRDSTFRWQNKVLNVSDSVRKEWNKRSGIKTEILADKIGYIRVPSIPQGNGRIDYDKNAQNLNDSLCNILSQNVKGLIIDLRINGGGAMYPMILGLEQLLGDGKVGSFKQTQQWLIKNNTFKLDTAVFAAITPKCSINAQLIPCILLIGPGTGSSGEFLTMTFKGRKKTALLGTETAGYVTAVNGFQINDRAFITLSIDYGQDRNGHIYTQSIQPDILINKEDNFNNIKNDAKVKAAIIWIKNQKIIK